MNIQIGDEVEHLLSGTRGFVSGKSSQGSVFVKFPPSVKLSGNPKSGWYALGTVKLIAKQQKLEV